jgi:ArsR family transcriptional regulator
MSDEKIFPKNCPNDCCAALGRIGQIKKGVPGEEILYDIADFFKVLGESTRLKILYALLKNEICVGELSESLCISQSSVSHQLRILRQNGLVKFRKQGKTVFYSLDDAHVESLLNQSLEHLLHIKIYE